MIYQIKINGNFSERTDTEFGVPQGCFRTSFIQYHMTNLFYEGKDSNVASYADDTTPYLCATDIPSGIKLELTIPLELKASATI